MSSWITPYFAFDGNCEEAVSFYQSILGGEVVVMRFGDMPANPAFPMPANVTKRILQAELTKDGQMIRFSDNMPGTPHVVGNNISFALEYDTKEETKATFEALSEGGKIEMALQETFSSPSYGKVVDRFGVMWHLRCRPQES